MTNLVLALLETPRPLSLREIGTAVAGYPDAPGPLRQAFERDKRTLRDGGIPIAVERIDGDDQVGYRILPEQYYLADLGLDEAETEAIAFALAAVRLDGTTTVDIAQKLGATSPTLPPLAVLPALSALGPLQQAIRRRATSEFSYRGRYRVVEGFGLVFRQGSWYLVGKDRTAAPDGAIRSFRVDRIAGEVTTGESDAYIIPEGFDAGSELRSRKRSSRSTPVRRVRLLRCSASRQWNGATATGRSPSALASVTRRPSSRLSLALATRRRSFSPRHCDGWSSTDCAARPTLATRWRRGDSDSDAGTA